MTAGLNLLNPFAFRGGVHPHEVIVRPRARALAHVEGRRGSFRAYT